MPRRRRATPRDLEAQVWDELDKELDELVGVIAAEEGLAKGASYLSPEQEVQLWGQRDPRIDYDTLKQQLMTGTVPPELYDPTSDRRLAVMRINEDDAADWQGLLAGTVEQPLDDEMASQIAEWAEWPGRAAVLKPYQDDPRAYVQKANSINERWRKRAAQMEQPAMSEPASTDPYAQAARGYP